MLLLIIIVFIVTVIIATIIIHNSVCAGSWHTHQTTASCRSAALDFVAPTNLVKTGPQWPGKEASPIGCKRHWPRLSSLIPTGYPSPHQQLMGLLIAHIPRCDLTTN